MRWEEETLALGFCVCLSRVGGRKKKNISVHVPKMRGKSRRVDSTGNVNSVGQRMCRIVKAENISVLGI